MSAVKLALEWIPGTFAVSRLAPTEELPDWVSEIAGRPLVSVTRTDRELSVVCPQEAVPHDVKAERGWVALRVVSTLDFAMIGVLANLTGALARAALPVLALSTFDTDILLVKRADAERAVKALSSVAEVQMLPRQVSP